MRASKINRVLVYMKPAPIPVRGVGRGGLPMHEYPQWPQKDYDDGLLVPLFPAFALCTATAMAP